MASSEVSVKVESPQELPSPPSPPGNNDNNNDNNNNNNNKENQPSKKQAARKRTKTGCLSMSRRGDPRVDKSALKPLTYICF